MTTPASNVPPRRIPPWIKTLFMLALVGGMATVAWTQLPRTGISTDLSVIGQGRPALVLTRDSNYLGGAEVLEKLNTIQSQYAQRVQFRIAHLGEPVGRAFAETYQTQDGDLTLFDEDGQQLGGLVQPKSIERIEQLLSRLDQ